jgi:RimJ/RimL family protein N-acetyltransferase
MLRFPALLESDRLILRRYTSEDAPGLLELVHHNRDQLIREFVQLASLRDSDGASSFLQEKSAQWTAGKTFCYGIWRQGAQPQIGQIQVKNIDWEIPSAELGYFIGASWQRQGYAGESINAILRLTLQQLNFRRIFLRILPANHNSFLLAKKLGFHEEGLHRNAFRCGLGELHDVRYLSLTSAP